MKKFLSLCLAATLALGVSVPTLAAENITVYADGSVVKYSDASPVRQNGTIMAPLRATFESMGATANWIQSENAATVELCGQTAKFVIGSNQVTVNGKEVTLPVKTYTQNGRTMVPLAAFSEALGYTVTNENSVDSYIIKAKGLIGSFATGDTKVAQKVLAESYIQHNLAFGTGSAAFIGAVEYLGSAPTKTTVENVRAFEEENCVFLQTVYNFAGAGEQVGFDVFRFENGKIAEHWDNLANIAKPNPSGHTQIDGTTTIKDSDKTASNKTLTEQFIKDVLMGQNLDKITSYIDGDNYIQHNTDIADGLSGLGTALTALAKAGIEMKYDKIHTVLGQGNFVLAVSEGTFGGAHTSYYDLFRVENGKIAEHWDVMETIAPEKDWANQNGKFGQMDKATKTVTVLDNRENQVTFAQPTERVAVISSPLVSVLDAMGVKIVAANTLKDSVKASLKNNKEIADIGSAVFIDVEKLKSSNPDVVVMGSAFGKHTKAIKENGMTLWTVDNQTYGELLDNIDTFGNAFNKRTEADKILSDFESRKSALIDKTGKKTKPNILVLWGTPDGILVARDRSFACDILKLLGCHNLANDIELEPEIPNFVYLMDEEKVAALNPDVIIRIYDGDPQKVKVHFDENDAQLSSWTWSHMNAAKNGKVFTLPEEGFAANPGITMMDSFEKLAQLAFDLK